MPLLFKILVFGFILIEVKTAIRYRVPHISLNGINYINKQWVIFHFDQAEHYEHMTILIHNPIFHLLKFSKNKKNKLLILFNDQLPISQIRSLHLNTLRK